MDAAVWVDFGEALALGVDFEAVEVTCGETPGVDILAIVAGFSVTVVTFFGGPEVPNGSTVLLLTSLVSLEAICTVIFSGKKCQEENLLGSRVKDPTHCH